MKNTIVINWINFTKTNSIQPVYNYKSNIFDLYDRPSYTKINIFNEWSEKLDCITWLTWNKFNFSIYWYIIDKENWQKHNVKITPSYNYVIN